MSEYRWAPALGGEIPEDACENGHGWEWRDTDDGGQERSPLWLVRSLPEADGSVRLGFLRRGDGAYLSARRGAPRLDEYEVLLDQGHWAAPPMVRDESDDWLDVAAVGLVCGRLADGTPLYAILDDGEGEYETPGEARAREGASNSTVLMAPVDASAASDSASAPADRAPAAEGSADGGGLRWARASGGEVPSEAYDTGHGWEFETPGDSDTPAVALWIIRTIAGSEPFGDAVRVGRVRRGGPATVGGWRSATPVDEYEVLLDQGAWASMVSRLADENDEDSGYYAVPDGALACGRASDGAALYAAIEYRDDEMGGAIPSETGEQAERNWERKVLTGPVVTQTAGSATAPTPGKTATETPADSLDAEGDVPPDATGYRWARASNGAIPDGAPANGHAFMWGQREGGAPEKQPLWLARSVPGAGGVRLGSIRRGEAAQIGPQYERVDTYEVLLDAGTWVDAACVAGDEDTLDIARDGLAVGFALDPSTAQKTPLFAALRDLGDSGCAPFELGARADSMWSYRVLAAPVATGTPTVAAEPSDESIAAEPDVAGPVAILSALDLKGEVAEITNAGDAPLDLGGWKLHDEGSTKGFVFPAGTVLEPGASVRVRSGPAAAKAGPGELKWKTARVWNDTGDTAFLKDPSGELVDSMKA